MKCRFLALLLILPMLVFCGKAETTSIVPPPSPTPGPTPVDPVGPVDPVNPGGNFIIVGYDYGGNSDSFLPDPTYLTHINFAFGKIKSDHQSLEIKKETRLKKIVDLKKKNPNLKVMLSIGGWGADYFSGMAADEANRKAFCDNCLAAVNKYGLDGIDLDWEYPGETTSEHIEASTADKDNFTLLVKDLRATLGEGKLITMASSAKAAYVKFRDFIDYMDFVNIMTYDMGDPPKHNAGLYASSMTKRSCDESVSLHLAAGVPLDKIVLGMAFYGRDDHNAYTAGKSDNFVYFKDIVIGSYYQCWDDEAKVPYLTDMSGNMVLSYDNEQSISLKAQYVKQKGLKGAMYWAIQGDDANWTLSKAIAGPLLGWTEPEENAFLATNGYIQNYLAAVDYTVDIQQHPYGDDDNRGIYSKITSFPGGGPSENDIELPPVYTITWTPYTSGTQKLRVWDGNWSREYSIAKGIGEQTITNLVPGTTYYWQVSVSNLVVANGKFATRGLLHQIYFAPNLRNGRDLGGWKGLDGKTIVFRKLYRGGAIHGSRLTEEGRKEMRAEGIRAEVDLREASDVPSSSPLGTDIAFLAPGFDEGYNHMIRDNQPKVKETFCWVVARLREGKPVYFHCAAGRDRTATLAVLFEGALGMSDSDMAKDYELTYFSPADWSMYKGGYAHTWDSYSFSSIRKYIFEHTDSGSYAERIVKYLLQIGVPQQDIDDLRAMMLQ